MAPRERSQGQGWADRLCLPCEPSPHQIFSGTRQLYLDKLILQFYFYNCKSYELVAMKCISFLHFRMSLPLSCCSIYYFHPSIPQRKNPFASNRLWWEHLAILNRAAIPRNTCWEIVPEGDTTTATMTPNLRFVVFGVYHLESK